MSKILFTGGGGLQAHTREEVGGCGGLYSRPTPGGWGVSRPTPGGVSGPGLGGVYPSMH